MSATLAAALFGLFLLHFNSFAQNRIPGVIDDHRTLTLTGDRHAVACPEFDAGAVAPDFLVERMILALQPGARRPRSDECERRTRTQCAVRFTLDRVF